MAELIFYFGTMGSGKSTLALQIHHNLANSGQNGLLLTQLDRAASAVSSRLGVSEPAIEVHPGLDLYRLADDVIAEHGSLEYLVCDEAQFYRPAQIDQLAEVVDLLDADVYAFGLLTDFRGRLFEGTSRLLELADQRQELQVEARCWCTRRATHNARLVDGKQVYEGEIVVVGDTGGHEEGFEGADAEVTYELLCRRHWNQARLT
ncbi:thymidine kinase [Actinomarinicola tropica]|uniref:Thymidine kinase n=1 Tax=Actinomarinicola tropica TaxID=2789776 RepID=A0A5Q2RDT5_9ACTN|nr:thymidine kinase [Actinomarinicola tropica]QGG95048.1 thymidine kinase [Actinomarinicola tropica]